MKTLELKKLIPHVSAVVLFVLITLIYFSPVLEGKKIDQQDIRQFTGMSKEIVDHRAEYDEEPLWTNSMFSGMPAYQISVRYKKNLISYCSQWFKLYLPGPVGAVFLYLIGFYFLLVSLGIDYRLAIVGAVAYAFSSYFFIIIEAGHNTKAHAIGYVAPILASFLMVLRGKKVLLGSALTALFTSLILNANHLQITYYLVMLLFIIGLVKFIEAYKEKALPLFLKHLGMLLLAGTIGSLTSLSRIATTLEYGQESIRGKSELTDNQSNKTSGLDKDYATAWSYGKAESFTLLIPNFHGGASGGALTTDSETYRLFKNSQQASQAKKIIKQLPLYWGSQPFTSGPVYAGAIVCFLFVLGLFLIKGYLRWWILTTFLLMLALSWGKNLMPLTDFFLEYIPGYNKFRAVSTTLVIVELLIPFLGILALNKIIKEGKTNEIMKSFKYALGIVGGLCLLFALMPNTFFDFEGLNDAQYGEALTEALRVDRASLFSADAFRSLAFILLSAAGIWLYLNKTIKKTPLILLIGVLILGDMWAVNKRYINDENFKAKRKILQPFTPSLADSQILQDPDPNYRVYNTTVSPFNDASTSYFHKSIGGYHGAKLKRYQELIDFHISKGNMNVLNMLNSKYFIVRGQNNQPIAQRNPNALGNAWFVSDIIMVENSDVEIQKLGQINTANQVVVDQRYEVPSTIDYDSTATIQLTNYKANHLSYTSSATTNQFAVFSEIYYDKGWNAYIDGELVPHIRANYLLRALPIPSGQHTIEFKFEPQTYYATENITLFSSLIVIIALFGAVFKEVKD
ncbi:MAG: YfhO family protein [Flavobacteriales bacterium]|nr:YfhO family protein [Flavobacteriales bacterium]